VPCEFDLDCPLPDQPLGDISTAFSANVRVAGGEERMRVVYRTGGPCEVRVESW
jgi:hypothetical protein